MQLRSGLEIHDPWQTLHQMRERWFDAYDGVSVATDSELRVSEIALSVMLNNRISGNTAFEIWEQRAPIEEALQAIGNDDLLEAAIRRNGLPLTEAQLRSISNSDLLSAENGIPYYQQLERMINATCGIHRVALGSATKILHKKRPALIPIFDSRVHGYYCTRLPRPRRCGKTGEHFLRLTRLFHADMLSVAQELRDLREQFTRLQKPLTASRILDHLIWVCCPD